MPKFNVSVEFGLSTEIEPEGIRFDEGDTEEFDDSSYFQTTTVNAYGGSLSFTVEAEDEDAAESKAREVVYDGMEVEDDSGFTWQVDDFSITVEEVEIPMDTRRAVELVTQFIDSMEGMDDELKLAFGFLLELVTVQESEIRRLSAAITA